MNNQDPITEIEKIVADIGPILTQFLDVIEDHEKRLQDVEFPQPKLPERLQQMLASICKIQDPTEKAAALAEFSILCRALGVDEEEF